MIRSRIHPTEITRKGSKLPLVAANGDINADNRADLRDAIQLLANALATQNVADLSEPVDITAARRELVATMNDAISGNREAQTVIAATLATTIYETIQRDGMMRAIFAKQDVEEGTKYVPVRCVANYFGPAVMATTPVTVEKVMPRDKVYLIKEVEFTFKASFSRLELAQSPGDLLAENQNKALEALMVREDRLAFKQINTMIDSGMGFKPVVAVGGLTPTMIAAGINTMSNRSGQAGVIVIADNLRTSILTGPAWHAVYSEVDKFNLLRAGQIGNLYGIPVMTEATGHPSLKVLEPGDVYVLSNPESLGTYVERFPVEVRPNTDEIGQIGFDLYSSLGIIAVNPWGAFRLRVSQ